MVQQPLGIGYGHESGSGRKYVAVRNSNCGNDVDSNIHRAATSQKNAAATIRHNLQKNKAVQERKPLLLGEATFEDFFGPRCRMLMRTSADWFVNEEKVRLEKENAALRKELEVLKVVD
eukprot:TRINITY_DN66089_c6_g5_i1.p2 TRINITY_DN66089_c6_g5~~TRINITY_DN66089_c6_g5_i1.p2  ORF type:complete len:119 (+),score=4.51 TRINITY_DN66089_c6_g5_i1:490-846(+)